MILANEKYIARLIAGWMNDSLTPKQERDLELWRQKSAANEEMFQRLSSPEYLGYNLARHGGTTSRNENLWKAIAARTTRGRERKGMRLALNLAAAAMLAGIVVTTALLQRDAENRDNAQQTITRHEQYPVLILPDGTSMTLDSEKEGLPIILNDLPHSIAADPREEEDNARAFHTLKVPHGCTYPLILADNTVVYLNSDSELTFPVAFVPGERRVFMRKGEAYFKVTRDESSPFVIESGPVTVEVLGTSFGLRSYDGEQRISTVIESGMVRMKANGDSVTLEANQQGAFEYGSGRIEVAEANPQIMLAWVRNRLVFDNVPLKGIMADLSRYYTFTPVFADPASGEIPFSMNVPKNDDFDAILRLIERTGKVRFEISGTEVRIISVE